MSGVNYILKLCVNIIMELLLPTLGVDDSEGKGEERACLASKGGGARGKRDLVKQTSEGYNS